MSWIKLHRKIYAHWIFKDAERLRAWIIILGHVNFKEEKVALGNDLLICKRGESLMSLDSWAKLFGKNWNKSKVRRFLNLLQNDSMIVLTNEKITTRLTVCNYDTYQDERNASETQVKRKRNASETQVTPTKESKEYKELKEGKEDAIDFDNFWTAYDYKKNKDKAKVKWDQLKPKDQKDILAYLPAYVKSTPDKQYRKHPATFLNNRGWEDEIIQSQPKLNNQPQQQTRSSIPVC